MSDERTYTARELCEMFGISQSRLSALTNGRDNKRNGRIEWTEKPLLSEQDYTKTFHGKLQLIIYKQSAADKLAQRYTVN